MSSNVLHVELKQKNVAHVSKTKVDPEGADKGRSDPIENLRPPTSVLENEELRMTKTDTKQLS